MSKRVSIPGLSALCALAMIGSVAATTMAQQVPVRVIQGSDGTLYAVQGSKSWTLVPDQIGDSDLAALTPSGEMDGTFPNELFVIQTSTPAPVAAPDPAAAVPAPSAPAAAPSIDASKIVGDYTITYGTQTVVTVSGSDGSYKMTAKSAFKPKPVGNTGVTSCTLSAGTVVATFFESEGSFSGQHGLWTFDCSFLQWTDLKLSLKGTSLTGAITFPDNLALASRNAFGSLTVTFSR